MTTETASTDDSATSDTAADFMSAPLAETPKLDAANPVQFELMSRMKQLDEALLARDPMMKVHLGAIHKQLVGYEELVHLLSDEEIGRIVAAQQAHTNTSLAAELTSKAGKARAAARTAKTTLDDL